MAYAGAEMDAVTSNKENCPELLRALRAKDESAQGLQQQLEIERKRRQEERASALAERASLQERHQQTEAELQTRLQTVQADIEQRYDDQQRRVISLTEQLEGARLREAELLEKNGQLAADMRRLLSRAEADQAEVMALQARVKALAAEIEDSQAEISKSDRVRTGLMNEIQAKNQSLNQLQHEMKELHLVEKSGREHSQAQHERLSAQCESLTRQAHERAKEADVFQERSNRLEQQLKAQELEAERGRKESEERRKDVEMQLSTSRDEVASLRDELQAKGIVEQKLKENIASLEAQLQDHKMEEGRLRQEIFRLQTLADERDIALKSGQRREQHLSDQVAGVQKRLDEALLESDSRQTALLTERTKVQSLQVDVQGAKEELAAAKSEVVRVRKLEEEARQEVIRRSDQKVAEEISHSENLAAVRAKRAEERVAQRDLDVKELEGQLAQRRDEIGQRDTEVVGLRAELKTVTLKMNTLERVLQETEEARKIAEHAQKEAEQARAQAIEKIQTLSVSDKGIMTEQPPEEPAEQPPEPVESETERLGAEVAALTRSVASMQAALAATHSDSPMARGAHAEEEDPDGHRSSGEGVTRHPPDSRWRLLQNAVRGGLLRESTDAFGIPSEPTATLQDLPQTATSRKTSRAPSKQSLFHDMPEHVSSVHGSRLPSKQFVESEDLLRPSGEQPVKLDTPLEPYVPAQLQTFNTRTRRVPATASSLDLLECRLAACERRQLITEAWGVWSAQLKVSALRTRLELIIADEFRLAAERHCRESMPVEGQDSEERYASGRDLLDSTIGTIKSLLVEFRQRVAEAVAEAPGASSAASGTTEASLQGLVATLELGRGAFGRLLHAALFLYQKLRTLVPSELEVEMRDPLSRMVPVPFYVLPYKVRLAVKRGVKRGPIGLARGQPPHNLQRRGTPFGSKAQVEELQDLLPLCASDPVAVPRFLGKLLNVRSQAQESAFDAEPRMADALEVGGAGFRDELDQLVADALTVYMSGWRLSVKGSLALPPGVKSQSPTPGRRSMSTEPLRHAARRQSSPAPRSTAAAAYAAARSRTGTAQPPPTRTVPHAEAVHNAEPFRLRLGPEQPPIVP
eukprot:TRINITY_DN62019_c0_g1_i1.p1 TRINITY_DN62019_c0_g1~~TRINITY_DN62019_c0_g1_i1.p1  ORF type:complete len:1094 (+),score=230.28 TRINITY_DN62019_c0_g1_i1:82-3363(+)